MTWTVRIQPSDERTFGYKATFSRAGAVGVRATERPAALVPRYLYGQGDLAVFLEDLGASARRIGSLLDELDGGPSAEISVDIADEALNTLRNERSQVL
ncbi:MAG: hypothetical protein M3542_00030 [Acidobacteriota bacterium]|nr:hypothetical protein [Acidobacteriota bacterium]